MRKARPFRRAPRAFRTKGVLQVYGKRASQHSLMKTGQERQSSEEDGAHGEGQASDSGTLDEDDSNSRRQPQLYNSS